MTTTIANHAFRFLYHDRPGPIGNCFSRWLGNGHFYNHVVLQDNQHFSMAMPRARFDTPATRHLLDPFREGAIQTPIDQISSLTASCVPAVSSTEACQTPVR